MRLLLETGVGKGILFYLHDNQLQPCIPQGVRSAESIDGLLGR